MLESSPASEQIGFYLVVEPVSPARAHVDRLDQVWTKLEREVLLQDVARAYVDSLDQVWTKPKGAALLHQSQRSSVDGHVL